jgi:hypothetical protein
MLCGGAASDWLELETILSSAQPSCFIASTTKTTTNIKTALEWICPIVYHLFILAGYQQIAKQATTCIETVEWTMMQSTWATIKAHRPRPRFITLHYAYFIGVCMITSVIFWGSSSPARSVRYIDSLFFTVSAMTEAGLNTVNLSTLNTFQQLILFFLIMLGSTVRMRMTYFSQSIRQES